MFYSILAALFLIKLFKKSIYHAPKCQVHLFFSFGGSISFWNPDGSFNFLFLKFANFSAINSQIWQIPVKNKQPKN